MSTSKKIHVMIAPVFMYNSADVMRCVASPTHLDLSLRMFLLHTPGMLPIVSNLEACYPRIVLSHSGPSPFSWLRPGMLIFRVTQQYYCFCMPPPFSLNCPSQKQVRTLSPIFVSARYLPREIPPGYP